MKHAVRRIGLSFIICHLSFSHAVAQDVTVGFDLSQAGHRFSPTWGLDLAWPNEQNLRKGINHMGKDNVGVGRTAFRFDKPLVGDSVLDASVIEKMRQRATLFNIHSTTLPLIFTADQEAGADEYFVKNNVCNTDHWATMINSHVHWMQKYTRHPILAVSPYNEPDYWTKEEGATVAKQWQLAKQLKEQYPRFSDIALVGGNTLNNDKALEWYTSGKQYYDWGNTHQLAGSMANYIRFFQQLEQDGKVGYADEMHNVGDAMVGLEYGLDIGIWWGFESRARGEFCDISRNGERLAYAEHRNNWTSASVYRHDDGRVKAFIGSSERQAYTTTYQFVSLDRDVYFDGYGPTRQFTIEMPGGTGYQKGQTNAERVVDITFGPDVALMPVTAGTYKLVNKATGLVLALQNGKIVMQKDRKQRQQQWTVEPVDPRIGGDYSFYDIRSAYDGKTRPNVRDFSTLDQAEVIAYGANEQPTLNERWYLEYGGDGYYFVRNGESAFYLNSVAGSKTEGTAVNQRKLQTANTLIARQLWRLLPADVDIDDQAPVAPTALTAQVLPAAVSLSWQQEQADDLAGCMVLRAELTGDGAEPQWNTIARGAQQPYTDNSVMPGRTYIYKVQALDHSQNRSQASQEVQVTTADAPALVARWTFDGSLSDASGNAFTATQADEPTFVDGHDGQDGQALSLKRQYVQLPATIVKGDELTVALWVNLRNNAQWQRLFDFGYDTQHYLFLTPVSGSNKMRLALRNGGDEQVLDCPDQLTALKWRHVAVTIADGTATIYVDGQQVAQKGGFTISPTDVHPVLCYLGRSQYTSDPLLNAWLQDVRIYSHALTATEVQQAMSTTSAVCSPSTLHPSPSTVYTLDGIRQQQARRGLNIIDGQLRVVE